MRSHLFSRHTSLSASCSRSSVPTSPSSQASKFAESHTQTTPSKRYDACTYGSAKKVCATGATSERPEHSMMRPSRGGRASSLAPGAATSGATGGDDPSVRAASLRRASTRSPRTRQHRHPFGMTTTSVLLLSTGMSWSSTDTLPNSFCTTATRCPCFKLPRTKLRNVVLPAPRKPVRIVTGTGPARVLALLAQGGWAAMADFPSRSAALLFRSRTAWTRQA
mmetsp:Transcript_4432/g.11157  ORF Transcript_4432/g.11157 Transcript_4432/m.11157 type:complete len:222 (+) Transcript_4432:587-1252(+)